MSFCQSYKRFLARVLIHVRESSCKRVTDLGRICIAEYAQCERSPIKNVPRPHAMELAHYFPWLIIIVFAGQRLGKEVLKSVAAHIRSLSVPMKQPRQFISATIRKPRVSQNRT